MRAVVQALGKTKLPVKGVFEVVAQVGGEKVTVRGAVVDGIARISTLFSP